MANWKKIGTAVAVSLFVTVVLIPSFEWSKDHLMESKAERDVIGFWGSATASIDWCERNYEVCYYIAEFWNTLSNLAIILLGLLGFFYVQHLERRYQFVYVMVMVTGMGSALFHATLLYKNQLADELPMTWSIVLWIYVIYGNHVHPKNEKKWITYALTIYVLIMTYIQWTITLEHPIYFQLHFLAACLFGFYRSSHMYHDCTDPKARRVYELYLLFGIVAIVFWSIDQAQCNLLRSLKLNPQLHAWWHVLMGLHCFYGPVFSAYMRGVALQAKPSIETGILGLPYVDYRDATHQL
eukprot:TRINITY_DN15693_c0_g1::TRINITY_DN15693_c0_g1_i1::g.18817::m.18817 TRINITY_DN15693_c0_g1::TRINITY_DN15693_c0_g1_i1::g.18817  ORF type:complete len:318 (-),score=24.05,sp/Q9NUN7/ACER3_HUMAN/33.85/3e-37,Ceramidase/PF05875.7/1.2e-53,DUF1129/PF06570.6/4.7e+02,DUF1129/PF06570.6/2.8e+03,DUF1129/PF06570.6/0.13,7TM-7TMR_HD/PF07698.6/1.1e+03,7TM-7TMR_HD/PF07698.6/0.093,7TM-7TMR_HD/PF07698.6/32,7TM-7TMR_HD/PF07698.6/3.3e+02,DUF4131/PF13567.1/6.7,DUF4131/PF13567.1/1.3e+02 TRINITY_DN15693_c0_g1_i1:43-930(-)